MKLSYGNPPFRNLVRDMMALQVTHEERLILDAIIEKLCGNGIIRAGEQIVKRATDRGFVCYTMPNYHTAENNCGQDKNALELNDIY